MTSYKLIENSDIGIITAMMQEFYAIDNYEITTEVSKNLFSEFISNENLGRAWLIYSDDEIIGYVILTFIFSFEYKGKIAFIDELYISEKARGRGIGKQTISFIKAQASQLSLRLLYLEVENHNENAQKLYLASDFIFHNRKIMKYKIE